MYEESDRQFDQRVNAHRAEHVSRPAPPPTCEPQPGDTVVITLKPAKVACVDAVGIKLDEGLFIRRAHIASIEKVPDPLPTTPGSSMRLGFGPPIYMHCGADGEWVDDSGDEVAVSAYDRHGFTVLFDAGKAT